MRVLTFTNLYPSARQPRHGIFVEHRMRQLSASGRASVRVVAPVPWMPLAQRWSARHAQLARVAPVEERHGITVQRPRFLAVPGLTSWMNPLSMALSVWPAVRRLQQQQDFDLIDAHFVFPDGAAALLLGRWLGKPVVVTARGTDINAFPRYAVPRRWIRWVTRNADALVTVSAALRQTWLELGGIEPQRVAVLRNGVDLSLFTAGDREAARAELGFNGPTLLSVGHLVADKGHHLVVDTLTLVPELSAVIVGEGPLQRELLQHARGIGVEARLQLVGNVPQSALARYYLAADATVLASKSEGMPNVLLESLACGTPVIATAVGGNAEVVSAPVAGELISERSAAAVAAAWTRLRAVPIDRLAVRRHAEQFGWAPTVAGLLQLFEQVIRQRGLGSVARPEAPARGSR
jgi:teichuronic acid biosynthesis glycosyltransferase TuaC